MTNVRESDQTPESMNWNLNDLFQGPEDPAVEADLTAAEKDARAFQKAFSGRLEGLSGAELGAAVQQYEAILERAFKVISYAQLLHAADTADPDIARFYQSCQERVTDITGATLFFTLELNRIGDEDMAEKLEDTTLGRYSAWIEAERQMRPYQLPDDLEQLLHDKSITGRSAWARLFDETMADLRFDFDDEELTLGEVLNRLTDSAPAEREKAGRSLSAGLASRIRLFSLVTNTIAKDKEIEDTKRDFPRPVSSRNLANQVEDEVVDALAGAVTSNYSRLSHRYYALKARWFGVDKLNWWDRNAPFPKTEERHFTWNQARETVLGAYAGFAPRMAETASTFFDRDWIDAEPRPGKNSGAFAHPVVPSAHPYVLMNFYGKPRDVMTLAHELGHGVHQVLAAPQGTLLSNTPLTLAETASVFGEMLTFRAILDAETDPAKRRVLLAGKVEDMLNTVVRQIAFHCFETRVHDGRKSGELTASQLGDIWMETQAESLGDAIALDDDYRTLWAYIPHFVHTPFYVYAYAFGDSLVNALYGLYQDGHPKFQEKYFEMLAAGGTLRHKELLAPFGLDASDPSFWNLGLDVISGFIDELEKDIPA
ncbi:MAG: M3 family oligoendopeptidase [Rhodospirillales bacterium]|nr:M3 family oligoendopeptidase [Rhodospirillales bacterium]MBO6787430.1 M3 family oligoendopeptidase [Rhodospirillales bacterium]